MLPVLADPEFTRLRSDIAWVRLKVALIRARHRLKQYNPAQQRVPAGHPDGGQWTGVGGDAGGSDWIAPRISLEGEEAAGGHAIRKHVGKTDNQLITFLMNARYIGITQSGFQPAEGSFDDIYSATNLVNGVINRNWIAVSSQLAIHPLPFTVEERLGFRTGKEAYMDNAYMLPRIRPTYGVKVVIQRDSSRASGFRVITAFPVNERKEQKMRFPEPSAAIHQFLSMFYPHSNEAYSSLDEWVIGTATYVNSRMHRELFLAETKELLSGRYSDDEIAGIWEHCNASWRFNGPATRHILELARKTVMEASPP